PAATPARHPLFSRPSIPCFHAASIMDTSTLPALRTLRWSILNSVLLSRRPTVSILATHFSFWRTSAADGIYSQPGFLLLSVHENQSRYVGSLQDLALRWRADSHTTFDALPTYYEAGAFLGER